MLSYHDPLMKPALGPRRKFQVLSLRNHSKTIMRYIQAQELWRKYQCILLKLLLLLLGNLARKTKGNLLMDWRSSAALSPAPPLNHQEAV